MEEAGFAASEHCVQLGLLAFLEFQVFDGKATGFVCSAYMEAPAWILAFHLNIEDG